MVFRRLEPAGLLGASAQEGAGTTAGGDQPGAAPRHRVPDAVWWAVPGLAFGVGSGVLIRRAAARHGAGPPREEPRQELIDLDL